MESRRAAAAPTPARAPGWVTQEAAARFTDFDSLVRTVSVPRGCVPYEQHALVESFPEPASAAAALGRSADHWLEVGRQ
ncbi:hypothetical protein [Streptomyces sp. NPDC058086]|uniref:hypothetical protein n=1 Tax=Streptomyces sp. NPDC058086 TaxID=3346334 RepID=UPI0036EFF8B4